MRDPSSPHPPPFLPDEDGVEDDLDPRVRDVLHTACAQLTRPPDEATRQRHLAAIHRTRQRVQRRRALARLSRLGAMATLLLLVLAVAGALPAGLQRTVADAATVVGVRLPSPSPGPIGDDGPDDTARDDGDRGELPPPDAAPDPRPGREHAAGGAPDAATSAASADRPDRPPHAVPRAAATARLAAGPPPGRPAASEDRGPPEHADPPGRADDAGQRGAGRDRPGGEADARGPAPGAHGAPAERDEPSTGPPDGAGGPGQRGEARGRGAGGQRPDGPPAQRGAHG